MSGPPAAAFDLASAFVHLADDGSAAVLPVDASFWETMDPRLEHGRMVSVIESAGDWPNWEMHPGGDELIYLLSGAMTLVLDRGADGYGRIDLRSGEAVLVPPGVWHTADITEPGKALFVTKGAGTQSRKRMD